MDTIHATFATISKIKKFQDWDEGKGNSSFPKTVRTFYLQMLRRLMDTGITFFFPSWPHPRHGEVPGPGIKPVPRQPPEPRRNSWPNG